MIEDLLIGLALVDNRYTTARSCFASGGFFSMGLIGLVLRTTIRTLEIVVAEGVPLLLLLPLLI